MIPRELMSESGKKIVQAIEEVTGIPFEEWARSERTRECVKCRQIYCFNARKAGKAGKPMMTQNVIAGHLGWSDHTAVLRSERSYKNDYQTNLEFRETADKVSEKLLPLHHEN